MEVVIKLGIELVIAEEKYKITTIGNFPYDFFVMTPFNSNKEKIEIKIPAPK